MNWLVKGLSRWRIVSGMDGDEVLRIGELSKRSGVSPELLRAWERRYGLLRPVRSAGGLRLYTPADVERVRVMRQHIADGLAAAEAAALAVRAGVGDGAAEMALRPKAVRTDLADALDRYDEPRAQAILDRLLAVATVDTLLSEVVLPYLRELGERWRRGDASVAQEHFASSVVRGRLLGLARGWGLGLGPTAVLACLPGEQHDLGLIAFGLALRSRGWRIVYLGHRLADRDSRGGRPPTRSEPRGPDRRQQRARAGGLAAAAGAHRPASARARRRRRRERHASGQRRPRPVRRPDRRGGTGHDARSGRRAAAVRTAVLGATGFVGRALVPALAQHSEVVAVSRRATAPELPGVRCVAADLTNRESTRGALDGVDVAYHLVHSLGTGNFSELDRRVAENVAAEAERAGVAQIVYLGGLGDDAPDLSAHLRSRTETGAVLSSGTVPVTTLRAAVVVGRGSAAFETIVALVDRLPVMVAPRWVSTPTQPIALTDMIRYLTGVAGRTQALGETFDVGGPQVITYREMIEQIARLRAKRPLIVEVPVLSPRLSSYWLHLVTPVGARVARPLIEGLRNPTTARENRIQGLLPFPLTSFADAARTALAPA